MAYKKDKERDMARELFMAGREQRDIAQMVGVSENTISKWSTDGGWKEIKSAKNITRPELVNKLLASIDKLIDQVNTAEDPTAVAGLADKLCKLSSTIERLDKKSNVVNYVECFISFGKWLEYRSQTDHNISVDLIKTINHYQDLFLMERMSGK